MRTTSLFDIFILCIHSALVHLQFRVIIVDGVFVGTDAVESWRREKLKETTELIHEKTSNSTISLKEASMF